MKLLVASVFDKKVQAFNTPHFFRTKAEAIRSFSDAVGDEKSPFCKHPEDFVFMAIGYFDDATGLIESTPQHVEALITALECVKSD